MKGHASEAELNDWIDDVLSARRRDELERHLDECALCAARYAAALDTVRRIRALPRRAEVPRQITRPLLARREDRAHQGLNQ